MNRKEFDLLDISGQVEYINSELDKGETLRGFMKSSLEISKSTLRYRFMKEGYIYNNDHKKYISSTDMVQTQHKDNTPVVKVENKPKLPKVTSVVQTHTPVVKSTTPVIVSNRDKKLDEMLKWFAKHQDDDLAPKAGTNDILLDVDYFTGGVKVTSVRMYKDVEKRFKDFSKKYPQFKTIDIMSQALLEYMEKYKSEK